MNYTRLWWYPRLFPPIPHQLCFRKTFTITSFCRIWWNTSFPCTMSSSLSATLFLSCIYADISDPGKTATWNDGKCQIRHPTSGLCSPGLAWMEPVRSSCCLENLKAWNWSRYGLCVRIRPPKCCCCDGLLCRIGIGLDCSLPGIGWS